MEVPRCPNPEHAAARVVRAGWYGKPPHRRQRWLCKPANGDPSHRFTPTLPRQQHFHAAPGGFCLECSTSVEEWEGQAGAKRYRFAAREVGEALAHLARGGTYRAASYMARQHAERMPERRQTGNGRRRRDPARDGQMVANWVDVFTGPLCDGLLPTSGRRSSSSTARACASGTARARARASTCWPPPGAHRCLAPCARHQPCGGWKRARSRMRLHLSRFAGR